MKVSFDDPTIRNLQVADKTYDCLAEKEPGFGIRIHPGGTMAFFYLYKMDGHKRFLNLGHYPTTTLKVARELYKSARANVQALRRGSKDGIDPVAEIKRNQAQRIKEDVEFTQALTVAKLIEEYIEKHAMPNKRSWLLDKGILGRDALPAWGKRKAHDITKRDVVVLLGNIINRGSPGSANNNFKIIRKMFNWAVEQDILKISPCVGVKMPASSDPKERTLDVAEIKTFWSSIDKCSISNEIKRALKLILVTAQRPGEVIGMHSKEIVGNWWTIPAERSKNKRAHRVFLTQTAHELIGPLKTLDEKTNTMKPKNYIFRSPHLDKEQPIAVNALAHAVRRNINGDQDARDKVAKRKGMDYKRGAYNSKGPASIEPHRLGIDRFTPHDLRRTATSLMASCKIIKEYRERVLNHTLEKLDGTYNLYDYDDEKQLALRKLERKLKSIIAVKGK